MPLPNNAKNDVYQRLERRKQVATLYLHGSTQWEIARQVGVTQKTVSKDLAGIRKEWLASALRDFDAKKAEELARLDHLEAIAWAAWERSCKPPLPKKDEPPPEPRPGDPRFLERVARCIEMRCRITGLIGADVDVRQTVNVDINSMLAEVSQRLKQPTTEERILEMVGGQAPLPIGLKELPPVEQTLAQMTDAELLERLGLGEANGGRIGAAGEPACVRAVEERRRSRVNRIDVSISWPGCSAVRGEVVGLPVTVRVTALSVVSA